MRSSPERRCAHGDVPEETSPGKLLIPAVGLAAVILIIQAAKGEAPFQGLTGSHKPDVAQELLIEGRENGQLIGVKVYNPDGQNVNFRKSPVVIEGEEESNKLGQLADGTPLEVVPVLGSKGDVWGLFDYQGQKAFIYESYLQRPDGTIGLRQNVIYDLRTGQPAIWDLDVR